jgi:hypothetical protein
MDKIPKISVVDPYIFLSDSDLRLAIRPDLDPDFCQDVFVAIEKKCREIGTTQVVHKSLNIKIEIFLKNCFESLINSKDPDTGGK